MRLLDTPNICHRNLGSLFSSTPELLRKRTTQASDGARLAVAGAQNGPELDLERMKARHLLHLQALGHRATQCKIKTAGKAVPTIAVLLAELIG